MYGALFMLHDISTGAFDNSHIWIKGILCATWKDNKKRDILDIFDSGLLINYKDIFASKIFCFVGFCLGIILLPNVLDKYN